MDIAWDDVKLFLAVAETGSLSAAAKRLRLGQPTVSRRLAALEYALGFALFRRGVSGSSLTSAGERWLEPARKMAEWAGEVGRTAAKGQGAPEGLVRLTAPPGVAWDFVAPFAGWLRKKHPGVRLEVQSGIGYVDLARGEADLALRLKPADQADLVTVCTLVQEVAAFASRAYAARLPKKYGFADVEWIGWAPPYESLAPNPQLAALLPGFKPVFTSDSLLVQWAAAEASVGAIVLGREQHRFSRPTSLVPLALSLGPQAKSALHLVCAKSALDIPRVRLVAELLKAELQTLGRS